MFFFRYNNKWQFAAVSVPKEFPLGEFAIEELPTVRLVGGWAESGYQIV